MTKEEIKNTVNSTREKLKKLEEKAYTESKGKYPIIKNQIAIYNDDLDFIERNLDKNLDENDLSLFEGLLKDINETADLDLESFVKENRLDSPIGESIVALQMAALDNEKKLTEEEANVETPPVENVIAAATQTEEVVEETTEVTEEVAPATPEAPIENDLDQVNTEEIINSLDSTPIEEVEPIPQDLVNDMINASNEATPVEEVQTEEVAPVMEAPVENVQSVEPTQTEEIANVPTQLVDINAIDNILNTLDVPSTPAVENEAPAAPEVTAPIMETPVAEQPVAVEAPIAPEMVATPEVTAPVMEAPVVEQPVAVEAPVAPEMVATPEVAAPVMEAPVAEQPIAVEAPVAPEMVATPEVAAPVMEAPMMEQPMIPEAPVMEAPQGPTLTLTP